MGPHPRWRILASTCPRLGPRANLAGASGYALTPGVSAEDQVRLREAPQRLEERIQTAAGRRLIQSAEAVQNLLLDLVVGALVLDDEQVTTGIGLAWAEAKRFAERPRRAHTETG